MSIKNTTLNTRSIYYIKYVTCAKVLQELIRIKIALKKGYIEITDFYFLETLESVLGSSITQCDIS